MLGPCLTSRREEFGNVTFRSIWGSRQSSLQDETLRLHMLHEAADAYGKAVRKAINPFSVD